MKLRSLRLEKRLTLARLSTETGLSTGLLSKLETDRMIPTLPTLATISRVYGVGMGHFFCDATEHSLAVTRAVQSQGRGRSLESGVRIPLNSGLPNRRMDATLLDLEPGVAARPPEVDASGTGKSSRALLIYVMEGRLNLDLGAVREVLDVGDCAYLESDLPVFWAASGKSRCRLLTVAPTDAKRSATAPLVDEEKDLHGGLESIEAAGV